MSAESDLPLSDLRILAVEQYGAGPFGSVHLAELGAEVIKLEDPQTGGDIGRRVPPHNGGGDSLFFETFNHNKLSVGLDLKSTDGRKVFERLVSRSDVVYSNLRGDVPAKLGLRYSDLSHVNPRIVCCSLSAFGTSGPHAAEPGYDYVVQGLAGWMWLTGEPGQPPSKTGLSLVDFASGYAAAISILAGVHAARRSGQGLDCDLALYDVAMNLLTYVATWQLSAGVATERIASSAHPTLVPFQNFPTTNGWIVVACAKEKFWARLLRVLETQEIADDPRFSSFAGRAEHRSELSALLEKVFRTDSSESWVDRLRAAGVPVAPVNDLTAALRDGLVRDRGLVLDYQHDQLGAVRLIRSAVDVAGRRRHPVQAPRLGGDTRSILREVGGLTADEIAALERDGVISVDKP